MTYPDPDYRDSTRNIVLWTLRALFWCAVLGVVFAQPGCVRSVTVCTQYDRRLGADQNGWQRDGMSASVCAEVTPPGAAH
jgi:hypothetical protein